MKKTNKRGFTIVELVIVIAVIGVLAAVLIPTFVKLVRKSKINTDTQLIRNLNTSLSADGIDNKHNTMSDALKAAAAYGYDVSQIKASANNNEVLWDSVNDVFCYYNDDKVEYLPDSVDGAKKLSAGSNKLWKIYTGEVPASASQTYSIYLGSATAANSINNGEIQVGLDVGEQNIDAVTYRHSGAAQEVVINTNSAATTLTIDAAADTVRHYGSMGTLNIIAVADASYHEFGKVAFAEIKTGRLVLESKSKVEHIHLTKTESVEKFVDITVAKAADVEMPAFSRDPIDLTGGSKVVVALQDGTSQTAEKDYVWLTAVGIYEQVTVSDSKTVAGTTYAAQSDNNEQKTAAQQIANNITFSEGGEEYKVTATKTGDTWTYEVKTSTGETAQDYIAELSGNVVTVQTAGETPTPVATTTENGLDSEAKENAKDTALDELAAEEVIDLNKNGANYVARIGANYYETFIAAVNANTNNKTINIIDDCYIDANIGNSQLVGALNCTVLINKDLTITIKNNAQVYMTNNCLFDLGGNTLTVYFDSSNTAGTYSGFVNCSLASAYKGKYQEYWEYELDSNNIRMAKIYTNFYGVEAYSNLQFGLIYTQMDGIELCPASDEGVMHNDTEANKTRINGVINGKTYSWPLDLGTIDDPQYPETARFVVESGAENYNWSVDGQGGVLDIEIHDNWVMVTALSDPEGQNGSEDGTLVKIIVSFTRANGDTVEFEWNVAVHGFVQY